MTDRRRFFRCLKVVAAVHVAAVLMLLVAGGCGHLFAKKPKEKVIPIEFVVAPPSSSHVERVPEPVKEVTPVVEKDPVPDKIPDRKVPEKPRRKRHRIKVSDKRVTRDNKPVRNNKTLTPEEIERRLRKGAKISDHNSEVPDPDSLGYVLIKQALHDVWLPPDKEAVGNRSVQVLLKIAGDGTLLEKRIYKASGNGELDNSVKLALAGIRKISGLSSDFLKKNRNKSLTVSLRVE